MPKKKMTPTNIILLTHEREQQRPTNTGRCVLSTLPERSQLISWQRKEPDEALLALIKTNKVGLVYPAQENESTVSTINANDCDHWLLLDATWQEARKMFNRSNYLKTIPRIHIKPSAPSRYRLRRNQKQEGLCTAECVIELLKLDGDPAAARSVDARFNEFNNKGN